MMPGRNRQQLGQSRFACDRRSVQAPDMLEFSRPGEAVESRQLLTQAELIGRAGEGLHQPFTVACRTVAGSLVALVELRVHGGGEASVVEQLPMQAAAAVVIGIAGHQQHVLVDFRLQLQIQRSELSVVMGMP